ncbi:MAG TPA: hypothetical protein VFE51_29270 [Verrucomicrobiae bacterium]|nr:hypothetical protein [Verrucomicrobiae bacterium]
MKTHPSKPEGRRSKSEPLRRRDSAARRRRNPKSEKGLEAKGVAHTGMTIPENGLFCANMTTGGITRGERRPGFNDQDQPGRAARPDGRISAMI